MSSDYSTKAKGLVPLGVFVVVGAIILNIHPEPLQSIGYILVVAGMALCGWGFICLAEEREFQLSEQARWLLVLPAALGAYLAALMLTGGIYGIVSYLLPQSPAPADQYPRWFAFLLVANVCGSYGFVSAGGRTAPRHRFATAVILGIGPLCVSTPVLVIVLVARFGMLLSVWSTPLPWVIAWVSGLIATIVACAQVRRQESIGTSDANEKHRTA